MPTVLFIRWEERQRNYLLLAKETNQVSSTSRIQLFFTLIYTNMSHNRKAAKQIYLLTQ